MTVSANASDNVGVVGVQFLLDGSLLGVEDTTSPYSISWNTTTASNGPHTLAARTRDAAGNNATSSIAITVDNQAPSGTVAINGGAAATNSRNVTLTLTATDALTSVTQMRFSNTGTSFSAAEAFAPTKAWSLTTGAGTKTVYVQFKDALGNWSGSVTDTIVFDSTAPTISARTATSITNSSARITWTTNEAATSQVDYGLTTSYGSTTTLDLALVTSHSVVLTGLAPSTIYNFRVRSRDAAGNESVSANSTFTTAAGADTVAPSVSMSAPVAGSPLGGVVNVLATASDNVGVSGVQFLLDGNILGAEDTTSPYSVSWDTTTASNGSHTLAARARDAATNTTTSAAISVTVDNQAPAGTVNINGGAPLTNNTSVTLSLSASDAVTSVTQMRFSNIGTTYSAAEAYATTKTWSLASGDGGKSVFVQFMDAAGNWSAPATATIVLDTTAPNISAVSTTGLTSTSVSISWTTDEPSTSQVDYGLTQPNYSTTTTLDTILVTSHSVTLTGLTAGATYNFRVRSGDAAGNEALGTNSTFPPDTTAPTVDITTPTPASTISGLFNVAATASDNVGVVGVQFLLDGVALGAEDTTSPYGVSWDTTTVANGSHTLLARARDTSNNTADSLPVTVTVSNTQIAGLVAAYSFDEGAGTAANDASSQGNTAVLINGVAWVAGQHGSAVSFDGVNDYISIPNSASTNISGNTITLSMWINPQPLATGDSVVLGKFWNTTMSSPYYQYGLELGGGNRTDFYVGTTSGPRTALAGTTLPFNQWSYLAITFDGAQVKTYVNGALVNTQALSATITARGNAINVGADATPAQFNKGMLDDLRIYNRVLTQAQIQTDMAAPVGGTTAGSPQVLIDFPVNGAQVSNIVNVTADATDDTGIASVQFYVDGIATGSADTTDPYALAWDTRVASNGAHTLTALATDVDGHSSLSAPVTVNVANTNYFQNEILATGFDLPTAIKFLPDGRMLVVELAGTVLVMSAPYLQPDPTPFLQITNIGSAGVQQGIYDIALDPNFTTNHYYYVFYTLGSPNRDRLSRFTANATLTGTIAGSEFVIYQDGEAANAEHHGGAINFGNDGKLYVTTGEHFNAGEAQDLTKPRGKILRYNADGTVPTDNPFYDGAGPNYDAVWALGLRNPYRAYFDAPTNRLIIGDVGGNVYSTAIEEVNIGAAGANYGWPNEEAPTGNPAYTAPAYYYPHNGRDSSITGGFVYHGTQFPSSFQGSYFFADYTQNWIRRLTFDATGNVSGVFNFEPLDGSVDGPYGDIVYLTEGPEGALYYLDLGYSDISGTFGVSKLRRISYIVSDLPPVAVATATPTEGPTPLTVNFSSAGTSDPELQPMSFLWTFGDGATSTEANPTHIYASAGPYQARLSVSDGVNSTLSPSLAISAGNRPTVTSLTPTAGNALKRATSSPSGATLPIGGRLAACQRVQMEHRLPTRGPCAPGHTHHGRDEWRVHDSTTGHDFSGFTRYRITLTVTDSSGLQSSSSVIVFPEKVDLTFDAAPAGLTLYLDGIAHTAPFVYDTLVGFNHTIEARNQTVGTNTYNFASWSDGGTQQHTIVVPAAAQTYTANYNVVSTPAPLALVQVNAATPQTNQTQVSVNYTSAQVAGDTTTSSRSDGTIRRRT